VSKKTHIPYATVKKHARAMGYQSSQRLGKPTPVVPKPVRTNFSGLPTLQEALARIRASSTMVLQAQTELISFQKANGEVKARSLISASPCPAAEAFGYERR
jgi:hypothetical protein